MNAFKPQILLVAAILVIPSLDSSVCQAQISTAPSSAQKVIIDTDIGDDIDDAFALALALRSPELQILGVTTTFGNTELRAKLATRFLAEVGRQDIPVVAGTPTKANDSLFSQRRYAERGHYTNTTHASAVDFILEQIHRYPNEITLIGIGPLVNVREVIEKDPNTFRKLKRVVIMGGSIRIGSHDIEYEKPGPPIAEWNIVNDITGAQKLFAAGVPLYAMPLDSTQLKMDEIKRAYLFRQGTSLTDNLTLLYHQWGSPTPTLYDVMAVAFAVNPALCPVQPMHIRVNDKGFTTPESGSPNAQVCLESSPEQFFQFALKRIATP